MKVLQVLVATGTAVALVRSHSAQDPPAPQLPSSQIEFVRIPPGEFIMGCEPKDDATCSSDYSRAHHVVLTKSIEMGKFLVTEEQWNKVMGWYSGINVGARYPVSASWNDTQKFLKRLTSKNKGYQYRLPTEAEWEYVARAGGASLAPGSSVSIRSDGPLTYPAREESPGELFFVFRDKDGRQVLACGDDPRKKPCPNRPSTANPWGLYQLFSGEWVQDWMAPYPESSVTDPQGPEKGKQRVVRGDIFRTFGLPGRSTVILRAARVDARVGFSPDSRGLFGFRCVRESIQ